MVRIVSGIQSPEPDTGAALRGYKNVRALRQEEEAEQRRQMQAKLEIQKAIVEVQKEKAKALKDANERAALGEVRAFQQQEMMRMLENAPPDAKRKAEALSIRQKLMEGGHEDAIKMLDQTYEGLERDIKNNEGYAAAQDLIERSHKEARIDDAMKLDYEGRLKSKRSRNESADDLMTEIQQIRFKQSEEEVNEDNNLALIAEMDAAIQAMPPGRGRKLAEIAAKEYKKSPLKHKEEGSGQKALAEIQKLGVGSVREFQEAERVGRARGGMHLLRQRGFQEKPTGDERAMLEAKLKPFTVLPPGEKPAPKGNETPGTHATLKQTRDAGKVGPGKMVDPKAAAAEAIQDKNVTDDRELLQALKARGVRLTRENILAAREAAEEWKRNADSGSR